jgi:lysophospholipase L1-like esterase
MTETGTTKPRPSRRRAWLFKLVAIAFSLLMAGIVAEIAVRVLSPQNVQGSARIQSPERRVFIYRPNSSSRTVFRERNVRRTFNSHHLRGPEIGSGRPRVLCVGDSFTASALIEEENTFVRLLEQRVQANFPDESFELLNGGAGGWGAADYVAFVEEFGERIDPDMIVVFFNGGDVGRAARSRLYRLSDGKLETLQNPDLKLKRMINKVPGYRWVVERSHLVTLVRRAYLMSPLHERQSWRQAEGEAPPRDLEAEAALCRALFLRLKAWCDKHDVALAVTTTGHEYSEHFARDVDAARHFLSTAPEFFASADIPFEDLGPGTEAFTGGDFTSITIPDDGHANEKGCELIADLAWEGLRDDFTRLIERRKATTGRVDASARIPNQP